MKNYTYWDEELGSYMLTEEGKKLSERDMINIMGILEHRHDTDLVGFVAVCEDGKVATADDIDILWGGTDVEPICGWRLPL